MLEGFIRGMILKSLGKRIRYSYFKILKKDKTLEQLSIEEDVSNDLLNFLVGTFFFIMFFLVFINIIF